jgi:HlyD family secretion protein
MGLPQPGLDDLRIERTAPDRGKRGSLSWVAIAAVIVAAAAVALWMLRPQPLSVETAVARPIATGGADHTVLNASGYVTARREATVSSKVTGKVVEVLVEEGVKVTAGQILARLDDTNLNASLLLARAQLDSARAGLEETRVRLHEAEQELARQTALRERNVSAQSDFDHAQAASRAFAARLAQQQADVAVATRNIAIWEQQVDDAVIRAPFAGVVTSKNAQPGEMISPMSAGGFTRTGICTIVDMDSLEIEVDVNESYINRVTPGQPVEATLDAYADWKIPCHVVAIIPSADRNKSTVKVRVGFDRLDPRILPEMSVKIAFRERETAAVAVNRSVSVPRVALFTQEGRDYVAIVREGRVERRAVTLAATVGDRAEVRAGLAAGEKVALTTPAALQEGTTVKEIQR